MNIFARWVVLAAIFFVCSPAQALDLDWSGQFRSELHWVRKYSMDSSETGLVTDVTRNGAGGYYIRGGGERDANFETLFLRLTPKVVVNDNVYIKSEWWLGDPVFGLFGNAAPYAIDQRQWYSNNSRGSSITAQRFWGEFVSDVGTVQVGRAPLNWGVGIVWNAGNGLFDRYQSTGDMIRLVSKFGSFSFMPAIIKYSLGNSIGGACQISGATCSTVVGSGGVSDYSLALKFENPEDDFEGGINLIKRIGGDAQNGSFGFLRYGQASETGQTGGGMVYNTWDIYARKSFGKFTFAGEIPLVSGHLGNSQYKTWAVATEAKWKPNDTWEVSGRAGQAPGQPSIIGDYPDKFRAFYFHPTYKLGLIMFNYQLANFAGPVSLNNPTSSPENLRSPFDNPVVNARYLSVGGTFKADKWNFHSTLTFASADQVASAGTNHFNTWERRFRANTSGTSQSKGLGWEMDYGVKFQWDDNFQFGVDFGWYFPGEFYAFSNTTTPNATSTVFASVLSAGVNF